MFQYFRSKTRTERQLEEARFEFRLGKGRVTASQALPGHRSSELGEVVHERQSLRCSRAAQGCKLRAECLTRRVPVESSTGSGGRHRSSPHLSRCGGCNCRVRLPHAVAAPEA
jgi:hypothetical protein